jgi:hypothetical protein
MEFIELNWRESINGYPCAILGIGRKPANQFQANPYNPKIHTKEQRKAVDASLSKWGWAGFVIENRNTGNVLDGHERIWEVLQRNENELVPYVLVDVPTGEEAQFLIAFDKTAMMSEWDHGMLNEMKFEGLLDNMDISFKLDDLFSERVEVKEEEKVEEEKEEEAHRGGMIIYFFFEQEEDFLRAHKQIMGYEFDGEGMSTSASGDLLLDLL